MITHVLYVEINRNINWLTLWKFLTSIKVKVNFWTFLIVFSFQTWKLGTMGEQGDYLLWLVPIPRTRVLKMKLPQAKPPRICAHQFKLTNQKYTDNNWDHFLSHYENFFGEYSFEANHDNSKNLRKHICFKTLVVMTFIGNTNFE